MFNKTYLTLNLTVLPLELELDPRAGKLSIVLAKPCCPLTVLVIVTSGALLDPAAAEFVVIVTAGDALLEGVPKIDLFHNTTSLNTFESGLGLIYY